MRIKAAFLAIVLFGFPFVTYSQQTCRADMTWIAFVNGIQNDIVDANWSAIALRDAHSSRVPSGEPVRYVRVHNPTAGDGVRGLFEDIIESTFQSWQIFGIRDFRDFWMHMLLPETGENSFLQEAMFAWVSSQATLNGIGTEAELVRQRHLNTYRMLLASGGGISARGNVILVAHSQGNFFANLATDDATDEEASQMRVVGVASPDNRVGLNGEYTTNSDDLMAQLFTAGRRAIGLSTLPPNSNGNLTVFNVASTTGGHSFIDSYLSGESDSREEILANIEAARASLRAGDMAACEQSGEWSFRLTSVSASTATRHTCSVGQTTCNWISGSEATDISALSSDNLLAATPQTRSAISYGVSERGTVLSASINSDVALESNAINRVPQGMTYPYSEASVGFVAQWELVAPSSFQFEFNGQSTHEFQIEPTQLPNTDGDPGSRASCTPRRLSLVNAQNGSTITFSSGHRTGIIGAGRYVARVEGGLAEAVLDSGRTFGTGYPDRSFQCSAAANWRLEIFAPQPP